MSVIKVSCIDQVMTLTNTPVIASGGVNENYIEFSFCSQWDGFAKVCAFYQQPGAYYHSLLDSTDRCIIPAEVCELAGPMYFGVVGVKDDVTRTSEVVKYKLVEGVMTEITDPTEDVYQQILAELAAVRELIAGIVMPEDIVTEAQFQKHTNAKDNPHGVTAEQVGAAPAAHTHTAQDVGAAPANHTHTAQDVGAAPADHTHTPASIGAAPADHTHTPASIGAAVPAVCVTVELAADGWLDNIQTVDDVPGMTADSHAVVTPAAESYVAWAECMIRATAQGDGTLTFACEDMPGETINVNILIVG